MNCVTSVDTDVFASGNGSESVDPCGWDWISSPRARRLQPRETNTMLLGSPPHWTYPDGPLSG